MKENICTAAGVIGGFFAALLGGWDSALITLVLFMAIDFTTGLIAASMGKSKHMLTKKYYYGDDFYPAIIDIETYQKANKELQSRTASSNQTGKKRRITAKPQTDFVFSAPEMQYDDPYEQAEYLYSLIERTVVKWQK